MAANGISTLANKTDRKLAKIALAQAKREADGTVGYRRYNFYVASVSPIIGRPWALTWAGGLASTGGVVGGLAATTIFQDPPMDGGNSSSGFTDTIDGGAAIFVP